MNQTLFLSQLRVIILVGIAFAAGKGWLSSADSSAITSILAPVGVIVGPWIWSIYSNFNARLVPKNSLVIEPHTPADATAPVGANVAGKVVAILLVAFALSLFLAANPALAQTGTIAGDIAAARAKRVGASVTPKVAAATTTPKPAAVPDIITTIDQAIDKLDAIGPDVVPQVVTDINAADADAATLTNPADPASFKDAISHACYPAGVKFLQSLPVNNPLSGRFQGVQLFQRKRDFVIQLQAGLPSYLKIGCGALLGDETKIFVAMLGMVGVTVATGGAGLFPAAAVALPSLSAL